MATLSDILARFIDQTDESDADALANEIRRLVNEAARCVAEHTCGEIAALLQRCGTALIWLAAEQRDLDNRSHRRGRMRAMLDLLDLCEAVRRFHSGRGDDDALHAMRQEIAAALRPLVVAAGDD